MLLRCLSIFFIGYVVFEIPSNIILRRWRPSQWLSLIVFLWGEYSSRYATLTDPLLACRTRRGKYGCLVQLRYSLRRPIPSGRIRKWPLSGHYLLHLAVVFKTTTGHPTRVLLLVLRHGRSFRRLARLRNQSNPFNARLRMAVDLHRKSPIDTVSDRRK